MLEKQRVEIDQLDKQIIALLESRLKVVEEVARIKKESKIEVFDSSREEEVLKKVRQHVVVKEYEENIVAIYREIMTLSKVHQEKLIK